MYHNKDSTQGGTLDSSTLVWPTCHNLIMVDYKALTRLSLKDLNSHTTSMSKAKYFLVSRRNMRKHTNVVKPLELRRVRVIYRVGQITHRAITINKRDQVIVTMHASKLKTKQEHNI
jgi:hypothetical protein